MMKYLKQTDGFSLLGLVVAVVILVGVITMYFSSGSKENTVAIEKSAESEAIAASVYHMAEIYISSQQAMGTEFEPNGTIESSAVTTGLDISNYKTIEVRLNAQGTAVKYVFTETLDGDKRDFPVGASGKAN